MYDFTNYIWFFSKIGKKIKTDSGAKVTAVFTIIEIFGGRSISRLGGPLFAFIFVMLSISTTLFVLVQAWQAKGAVQSLKVLFAPYLSAPTKQF